MTLPRLTISIVSHLNGSIVQGLLDDIARSTTDCIVVVTINVPEPQIVVPENLAGRMQWQINKQPLGFGANHNAAFKSCVTPFFCALNPDLRWNEDPFPHLVAAMADPSTGLAAPRVVAPDGTVEDSVRRFPTILGLGAKFVGASDGRYRLATGDSPIPVDWVAGMFMLFRSECFAAMGGFDDKFFLYYEDVDICARLWRAGYRVLVCPSATVVHDAQRASRHDWRYRRWHAQSMLRYFAKHWLRLPRTAGPDSR